MTNECVLLRANLRATRLRLKGLDRGTTAIVLSIFRRLAVVGGNEVVK